MWYFKAPEIVFGEDALSHLQQMEGARALIVTDGTLVALGVAGRIENLLHGAGFATELFGEVEPEPSLQTVQRGVAIARRFQPDWIVGLGGGSPLDAAKAIWALYERPDLEATDINPMINLNFSKARMCAIPTTAGTGSEATWAIVLTDTAERRKFSTGSRELIPTVAIIDPELTQQLPARITADTGLDALTHAIEGYVCTWHNDFTDPYCLQAAALIFTWLERAYRAGSDDSEAREKMGIAATLAGMGFGNSNLGLAHAMGHALGAYFKQPHGRSVSVFLPLSIEFTLHGGIARERYAEMAHFAGLVESRDIEKGGRVLLARVRALASALDQPQCLAEMGIGEEEFSNAIETLCDNAEADTQFFTAPRIPDRDELVRLFHAAYRGAPVNF